MIQKMKQTEKSSIELTGLEEKVKYTNLEVAIECLEWVATDFQLDPNHEDYCGFINLDPVDFQNPRWTEFFSTLYKTHRYFQIVFDHFGLELESAVETEVIISRK